MLDFIVYAVTFSAALSVVALCLESLAAIRGRPRRAHWMLAMLCSTLLPLLLALNVHPEETATPMPAPAPAHAVEVRPAIAAGELALPAAVAVRPEIAPSRSLRWQLSPPSGRAVLIAWTAVSVALLGTLIAGELLLRRRSARWQRTLVHDLEVMVSENTGPALVGALRPRIVVPRWFMDEPADTQYLILEHERQHIAARDPLLLRVALVLVIGAPWNLPLWWQLRRLRLAIEMDCDARVLKRGAGAARYGEVLLAVSRRATGMPAGAITMSEPVSALEQRIRNLAREPGRRVPLRAITAWVTAAAGMGAAVALEAPAVRSPAPQPPAGAISTPAPVQAGTRGTGSSSDQTSGVDIAPSKLRDRMSVVTGSASPDTGAVPAQQPGTDVPAPVGLVPPGSIGSSDCAAARAWCRDAAIREALARDPVIDDRRNEDGSYVDPLTFGKPINADAVDLGIIPPNLLQRMDVVTGGAAATYGSGAMAGVVNLVLNNRLRGFDPRLDFGPDSDQFRLSIGTSFPIGTPADSGADDLLIIIIPGENSRAIAPRVHFDQYVGDDSEVVTALVTMQAPGLWNPQVLAPALARLVSPSGHLSVTPDGAIVVDTWENMRRMAAALRGQSGQRQPALRD